MAKNAFNAEGAPAAVGPYSHAAWAGNTLLVSGQIALDQNGKLLTSDIKTETKQVLENVKTIIQAAGLTMDHIVKCSIFLNDMDNFTSENEVYAGYFPSNPPARECVAVRTLPKHVNVEISVIAYKD